MFVFINPDKSVTVDGSFSLGKYTGQLLVGIVSELLNHRLVGVLNRRKHCHTDKKLFR